MNRLKLRRMGSGAEKGRHAGPTGKGPTATPAGTKARRSSCRPRTRKAGSGTSRCTTTSSASAWWRRSTICSRAGGKDHETIYFEEVERCPGGQAARWRSRTRSRSYFATKEYSYRAQASGRRRLGAGRRRLRLSRPALFVRRAAGAQSGELAADAIAEGLAEGDTSAAQLGKWEADFNQGMDRMRRLVCEYYDGFSFGRFVEAIRTSRALSPIC